MDDTQKVTISSQELAKFIREKTGLIISAGNVYRGKPGIADGVADKKAVNYGIHSGQRKRQHGRYDILEKRPSVTHCLSLRV